MSTGHEAMEDRNEPGLYEIRIKGHLDDKWAGWFDGLAIIRRENGETLLRGPVDDQAALHGLLRKVRDLGLPLLAVNTADPRQVNSPNTDVDAARKNKETNV
jgi:hypothetical protein